MKTFEYLNYILKHKWYVFTASCKLGVPLQGLAHDASKFLPSEWFPYKQYFYGKFHKDNGENFNQAWNLHQKRNKHHWQYWVLIEDSGKVIPLKMPDKYVRAMVADWIGAGRAIPGGLNVYDWYILNRNRMMLHGDTRNQVEELLYCYVLNTKK